MKYGDTCEVCGKPAMVQIDTEDSGECHHYCFNCHNREMAELYDTDMPDFVPERLSVPGRNGRMHEFDIEFIIFGTGKSLTATEVGKTTRKADVWGSLDDDFDEMLDTLKRRIKKALSVKYMDQDGHIKDQKMVGYIDYDRDKGEHIIFVDGKPFSWEELGRNIPSYEGWKIKIEFGGLGEELD
jgi:hypothetical protein